MTQIQSLKSDLVAFGAAYSYDVTYVTDLVDDALPVYEAFMSAQPLLSYRKELPLDAYWIARISAALTDDCGACAQLGLRRAVQEGVSRDLLRQMLDAPEQLPGALADVQAHARAVCGHEPDDAGRAGRLRAAYGSAGLAEIALGILAGRMYPTLKRGLSRVESCARPNLDF